MQGKNGSGWYTHHDCDRKAANLFIVVDNAHPFEGHETAATTAKELQINQMASCIPSANNIECR
jgi:hypothetical protein